MKQLSLFDTPAADAEIPLSELFEAYFDCRRNKRRTMNALAFEEDYENELIQLWREVNDGTYRPGRSIAFIITRPVQREIFAADFRDRVVHHLVINKLNPLFEKEFIHDSYACRKGKGTLFGIRRAERFIRQCSENYTRDCYILKLDIEGFFMRIDRNRLFNKLERFIFEKYKGDDINILLGLIRQIVFYEPTIGCHIKGGKETWRGLPDSKSLFHSPPGCGLPIGNLTSQIFANFYMTPFDHFMKHDLGLRYYGRYVDDFVVVHPDKEYLKSLIPIIRDYFSTELGLKLHPRKIYLQHYSRGVKYLGAVIKPYRIYIASRTAGNFYQAVQRQNNILAANIHNDSAHTAVEQDAFLSSMNSYLGMMKHYASYNLRSRIVSGLSPAWWSHIAVTAGCRKFVKSEWYGHSGE